VIVKHTKLIHGFISLLFILLTNSSHAEVDLSKIEYADPASAIRVTELNSTQSSRAILVNAIFTNSSNNNLTIFYHFDWLDASGNKIDLGEPWRVLDVAGNTEKPVSVLSATSMDKDLSDYRLEVRVVTNSETK
jgi:uncharacterized protein YcfL